VLSPVVPWVPLLQRGYIDPTMAYVITEPCIGTKDKSCVDVCPVDSFYEGANMLVINPDECIDCGVCQPECPAEAIFPEALGTAEMWREFARRVPAPKLANMTEFGRTPFFTAAEFQEMGYRMVIWPVSSLRVAAKAQEELYASIRANGGAHKMVDRMQTRAELYAAIGYHEYEALDTSIVTTVIPTAMPQTAG